MIKIDESKLAITATYAATAVATILLIFKAIAWFMTGSLSVQASLMDSTLDALMSAANVLAIKHSRAPADNEHRFGHGKIEGITGMLQAAFTLATAIFICFSSIKTMIYPNPLKHSTIGVMIMLFSFILTLGLVNFQKYVIKHTGSLIVASDALHYKADMALNLITLIALLLSYYTGIYLFDSLFALGLAFYIMYAAYEVFIQGWDMIMDKEIEGEIKAEIEEIINNYPGIKGYHDLRTRKSGSTIFVQLHAELDGHQSLYSAHRHAKTLQDKLTQHFKDIEVIVHEDPDVKL